VLSVGEIEQQAEALLRTWLGPVRIHRRKSSRGPDLVARTSTATLALEIKRIGDPGWLRGAIEQVRTTARGVGVAAVPVVVVPFMGELGRKLCRDARVSWFDLSGNASIIAPGLRIHVEGRPNLFKRAGRPSTAFAPKSSRIVRHLLLDPDHSFRQRELAARSGLDEGFTSRIVKKLEDDRMVQRQKDRSWRVVDPNLLLDAWRENYDFKKHLIVPGHVVAKSGPAALESVAAPFREKGLDYAVTGLAAAWLLTQFAAFRLVTLFVPERPPEKTLRTLGFRNEERGANVWFVVPDDEGVFAGANDRSGFRCVHPVQAYLDLKGHPERSADAAAELRNRLLMWKAS